MNRWAVIKTGGKQYKVVEGEVIHIEKLAVDKDPVITFKDVLLAKNERGLVLGKPIIAGAKVQAKVLKKQKGAKIRVVKFKSKSRYLKTYGHRQTRMKVLIEKIQLQ
ncbi:50S ribosomal protein L21 [Candidatus Curtissbacteria bacterium RIFCSPHIGHO2_01_FULL_41_44]|uniref:Large ribosomal subunit protein bL21 n=1 Tax=Candidatus Curtissbacteria bacterium RIFCSPLOWO2_01_FULL_42_50 TaxID=1797730 RepID=A0A1F5H3G9_9BACT|nr:MAG: 50S ribosomal protein L21 [Candidatus Curtissbacteria bacterium RIFCSPHIGHO2_02_FULL_42_58]OGD94576.1 MAG: 50S ribosomal protein L21 [Candidatus Curtissbacteria bacterium RIFCSPHIGHO2_01_FULL_41_44]OGD97958.1 MAG: 50S ribosomal protein L21 [Candidatus Curtissbacteria bacterium RIFCSPHIGHO2_12_FULL_42_33]OGD98609.1 MAG: 50S ribosomal protein L21 [Candidatus Curtissbacteria bacterium RIFCSPLOWO2_01_FULL_42_50]OGE02176.1 MAG: 50S ribosomal protein L21 [Candidatus Curtissbacteria bacterium 